MRNDIFLKEIGSKIKAARKAKKITLPQLSELCETDMSNLWFIEKGQRNLHVLTLKNIAEVLGINIKQLF